MDYRIQMLNLNFRVMKISKYLLVAAASVMLFSCAKDDNNGASLNGHVALNLNIVSPMSKAEGSGTTGEEGVDVVEVTYTTFDVKVTGNGEAIYNGGTAAEDGWYTYNLGATPTIFVEDPTLVEVRINDGKQSYAIGDLNGLQATLPTAMAAYGATSTFVRTTDDTGNSTVVAGNTTYELYKADVTLEIPVARVEISGIQHVDEGDVCEYSALNLDNYTISNLPASVTYANAAFPATKGEENWVEGIDVDFMTLNTPYPTTEGNVYGCYILPTQAPMLQFILTGTIDGYITNENRYATVKTINGTPAEDFAFEAGKIYRITDVKISDKDMGSDAEGNTPFAHGAGWLMQGWMRGLCRTAYGHYAGLNGK